MVRGARHLEELPLKCLGIMFAMMLFIILIFSECLFIYLRLQNAKSLCGRGVASEQMQSGLDFRITVTNLTCGMPTQRFSRSQNLDHLQFRGSAQAHPVATVKTTYDIYCCIGTCLCPGMQQVLNHSFINS